MGGLTSMPSRLNVMGNPILIKCARARLRWKHMLSWGTITLALTAFVCMLVYLTMSERGLTTEADAARTLLIPIIIIQSAILMFSGTGSVASGMVKERETNLLDYHRMTPMSPTGKIIGFLFGLPVREYFLFALTLPFLVFAVAKGGFPIEKLGRFYIIFFSSVLLYHMTGMVAGMVSNRPRAAAMAAQGMVIVLYFVLPRLEVFGFRFFEHLTILPTFIGLVLEEIGAVGGAGGDSFYNPDRIQNVPFYDWSIPSFWFTLLVQGFLMSMMLVVMHRKWRNEHLHPFSKFAAFASFAGVTLFLLGNLWPIIVNPVHLNSLMARIDLRGHMPPANALAIMLLLFMLVSGGLGVLMINLITPSRHTKMKGLHLARKLGKHRVHPNSDAASSLLVTVAMILITTLSFIAMVGLANKTGGYFVALPHWSDWVAPIALSAVILLFVQGLRERFSARTFLVTVFLFWMMPFFACMILYSAKEAFRLGTWIALPFPPMSLYLAMAEFLELTDAVSPNGGHATLLPSRFRESVRDDLPAMLWSTFALYAVLAGVVQAELFRRNRRLRAQEIAGHAALSEPPASPITQPPPVLEAAAE